ncbi:MAG: hypothetical protein WCY88_13920 [Spongiibacteraceae bacterium]
MTDIAIIDIEASGLHFDAYPIEIAILKKGEIRSWLIRPEPKWTYWCDTAESMHGISRGMLMREGLPAIEVVNQLSVFLEHFDGVLYSDADRWDADWMDTLYFAVKQCRELHIASIYDLLAGDKAQQFNQVKAGLSESGRFWHHRAESDVKMIGEAFAEVIAG